MGEIIIYTFNPSLSREIIRLHLLHLHIYPLLPVIRFRFITNQKNPTFAIDSPPASYCYNLSFLHRFLNRDSLIQWKK
ncbi:hypothetical protein L6452_39669 [Arctium lappa]|uniref:Uncharacterized protein n=1 Tax=Arctium lappa TaxID=4217 RepID=A0ACB8XTM8_ARCLA|nr:hypothetical protein L6452_39669 [Arctium lappa]